MISKLQRDIINANRPAKRKRQPKGVKVAKFLCCEYRGFTIRDYPDGKRQRRNWRCQKPNRKWLFTETLVEMVAKIDGLLS